MDIALIGIGKIAVDQHVPSLKSSPDWELAATVSRSGTVEGVEAFISFAEMLQAFTKEIEKKMMTQLNLG